MSQQPSACPFSAKAQSFDPFGPAYQEDPAEALRWSREEEPVFYAPELGYWVLSRYEDIKAVFRDNITFSPAIALEKIAPVSQKAMDVLRSYDYAMNRTLVNEDEPQHTERRRALMADFEPARLQSHEEMVRRLTVEAVDRFIDAGKADLVNEMLWEIPLSVALHFLGVPEDDMDRLREFSVAHTVNTWGKPTDEEQVAVAHSVGKFWKYAGKILEKMRANPDMPGWMPYAIRKQRELPDVVTDSYLHSMMMAIIVAGHETTAHASANMFRRLLENRHLWEEVCKSPELIPNTVEECLRHSGSVVAWRRVTTKPVTIDGTDLPEGAKLLIVTASANHDPRHFPDPDEIDLFRDNTTDHLTFGYGSHQCMGKNLARMEMRIFLEEVTRRLPHMELVPDQTFTFLPNTSFRGPEHLHVRWNPENNPERRNPETRTGQNSFEIGAPNTAILARTAHVVQREAIADGIARFVLASPDGEPLPAWTAGGHIDLVFNDYDRKYSLCGKPAQEDRFEIAVLREDNGRGGSRWLHDNLQPGMSVRYRGPKNHFLLDETADTYTLIAGGIGITPIIAMADRLKAIGKLYHLHYCGKSRQRMALLERALKDHADNISIYAGEDGHRLELKKVTGEYSPTHQIYACGPERLLDAISDICSNWPEGGLHIEHFSTAAGLLDPENEHAFEAELTDSGFSVSVSADQTLLQALRASGIDVASDCEEGLCGSCEVTVVSGEIDHRDKVLSREEHREGKKIISCCSRAKDGTKLKLVL